MTLDITSDFVNVVDRLEPVTLTVPSGRYYDVDHAHRNEVTRAEHVPSHGSVLVGDVIWWIPIAESCDPLPLGSTISARLSHPDPNYYESWTVLSAAKKAHSSVWALHCRNLAVSEGLDTYVTILQATRTKNSDGEHVQAWTFYASNIRAKVQPETTVPENKQSATSSEQTFLITLQSSLDISPSPEYRIVDSLGRVFGILRYARAARIDVLPQLSCRLLVGVSAPSSSSGV